MTTLKELLLELQTLINKANLDYKNRNWSRYSVYCAQFNKLLLTASSSFKDLLIAPIDLVSNNALHNQKTSEAYDALADRVKFKEVIDKATGLFEKLSSLQSPVVAPISDALTDVELVCNNFCSVIRELRRRSDKGTVLDIDTNGDALYLMKALLRLYFDAIFEDTWDIDADATQMSLLLPNEKIAVIVKKANRSMTDSDLIENFEKAVQYYSQSKQCSTLFYFIYDPDLRISQPLYLENKLILLNDSSLNTRIFVRPLS